MNSTVVVKSLAQVVIVACIILYPSASYAQAEENDSYLSCSASRYSVYNPTLENDDTKDEITLGCSEAATLPNTGLSTEGVEIKIQRITERSSLDKPRQIIVPREATKLFIEYARQYRLSSDKLFKDTNIFVDFLKRLPSKN